MIEFACSTERWLPKGHWRFTFSDGKFTATIACPNCGAQGALDDHDIADDGRVTPSVVCECGFHNTIQLSGWMNLPAIAERTKRVLAAINEAGRIHFLDLIKPTTDFGR